VGGTRDALVRSEQLLGHNRREVVGNDPDRVFLPTLCEFVQDDSEQTYDDAYGDRTATESSRGSTEKVASLLTGLDLGAQAVTATDVLLPESASCARERRRARVHCCISERFPVLSRFGRFERTEYTAIGVGQRVDFRAQQVQSFRRAVPQERLVAVARSCGNS
jgi:hypothetical protein